MEEKHQREWTLTDYVAMLRRRWVLVLILTLIGPPLAYGISYLLPKKYTSKTLVLIEPPNVKPDLVPVDMASLGQQLANMQQQILSRSRLEPIIRSTGVYAGEINKVSMDDLATQLQKAIDLTPVQSMLQTGRDLPGFYVSVTLPDPGSAQKVSAAVTSMFIDENTRIQQKDAEVTTDFLTQQLVQAKADLDAQDAKLAAFKSRYLGSLPDDEATNLNVLSGLTSQLDATNQALARAQQDKSFAQSMLTQQLAAWQASAGGINPDNLVDQLAAMQAQLANLELKYTDDYPDVVKAKHEIAELQKKIAATPDEKSVPDLSKTKKSSIEPPQITQWREQVHATEQIIAEKTKEQEHIQKQIELYQSRVQGSPMVEEQYKELTRGYQTALDSYNDLLKKKTQSVMSGELNREQQGEQFVVLDPANFPNAPSFPNRLMFALDGLVGGLGLGVGLMLLLEMQDTSLRTESDVEFRLRLPVLAMVPAIDPLASKKVKANKTAVKGLADTGLGLHAGA